MELPKDFEPDKDKDDDQEEQDQDVGIFLYSDDDMMERQKSKQLQIEETELVTETAWDIFNVHLRPNHDEYVLNDNNDIPILTETLNQHGLNGLNTGDVIEIIGNSQCGKTYLLYKYLLNCILPKYLTVTKSTIPIDQQTLLSLNGHNSRVIWIDLHLTFNKNRLKDIYLNCLKLKINKHNHRIQQKPKFKYQQHQHRHTMPPRIDPDLHLNQDDIDKMKDNQNLLPIDLEKFLKSTECHLLWKYVEAKIILIQPLTPIELIISIHKLRSILNELYTNRISTERMIDNYLEDKDQKYTDQQGKKMYYVGDSDDDDENDNDDDKKKEEDITLNHRINQILRGDDKGVRMVIIDDINTFFNELSANYDRDKYYSSFSSHLMDLCEEYDLFVIMSRFAATKAEKEWLRTQCPLNKITSKCNTQFTLRENEYFHNRFAKIDIERKCIFVIFLYRETMEYVDSTTSHPGITNDLYFGNKSSSKSASNEEVKERRKFLMGNENVTRDWIQRLSAENQDPLTFITSIKQQQNVKTFGCEDYFYIRGFVMTKDQFLFKIKQGKQNRKQQYKNAIFEKKMIPFYLTITNNNDIQQK